MYLPFYIAKRYLFAKKSHNVINIISAISAIGMAIGTAALIIILSIFNGFESLIRDSMSNVEPDLYVKPAVGKVFIPDMEALDWINSCEETASVCNVLEENVYVSYDGRNALAKAKGVDDVYEASSPIRDHIVEGKFRLYHGDLPKAIVGAGLANALDLSPRFFYPLEIYFPSRTRKISLSNPVSAIEMIDMLPSGVFSVNGTPDKDLILLPIAEMRELLEYTEEVSGVEIRFRIGLDIKDRHRLTQELKNRLGSQYLVLDRFQQNPSLYKMMKYEKASVYLILLFVVIIIGFNIFGSLAMLIIEKKHDIGILNSMGADTRLIRRIFILEGWLISLIGMAVGLVLGLLFCWLQTLFGFIRMPGSFLYEAYPMIVKCSDVLFCILTITLVGYLIALLPTRTYLKKI